VHTERSGSGRPLVLVPGVGGTTGTWRYIMPGLQAEHEVVSVELPGFGRTPALTGQVTVTAYADALAAYLRESGLERADLVGSSLGARLVLEMARRGLGRSVVALDPGGFWSPVQRAVFGSSLGASVRLVRALRPALPALLATAAGRTALLAQLSARPWAVDPGFALAEVRALADAPGSLPAIRALARGPLQEGAPAGTLPGPVLLVWGKQDRVAPASQAPRALARFPGARLELLDACGHFPHWDQPARTIQLVLAATA